MWMFTLFADGLRDDPLRRPEVIWGTAALAGALLFGAFAVWMVDKWRKKSETKPDATGELTGFRGMFDRGEITQDEYAKLRERVAQRVKTPPKPPDSPPSPTPPLLPPLSNSAAQPPSANPGNPSNPPPAA